MMLGSCVKDVVKREYTFFRPEYKTKDAVRSNIKSSEPIALQQPGKIFYRNGFVFISELDKGVHIIDISNPSSLQPVGFVAIPGCVDIAVRENTLYADMYTDLVAVDISNPHNIKLQHITENVFPHRLYGSYSADTGMIITDWVRVDTVVTEVDQYKSWGMMESDFINFSTAGGGSGGTANGTGGSMARFALAGNYLYTVNNNSLTTFNVTNTATPQYMGEKSVGVGWGIETIFPYKNNLFIGSQTGMYILSLSNPQQPELKGKFDHARVCDPVVATDNYAYVTLRDGTTCQGFLNQLDIVDISTLDHPKLVKSVSFTNPHGLGYDNNMVLICDGRDGLKILDVTNPDNTKLLGTLAMTNAYDVIPLGSIAIVLSGDGLLLVDYSKPTQPMVKGKINITTKTL